MCNLGRGHHEERFCEIILNLDQWFRRRSHLKIFLIHRSGDPCIKHRETVCAISVEAFVQWSGTICAVLVEGIKRNNSVKLF